MKRRPVLPLPASPPDRASTEKAPSLLGGAAGDAIPGAPMC